MNEQSSCVDHNLNQIQDKFGTVLRLSVAEMAELLSSTPNNVVQMRRRGHFPFNTVSVGSRVFFPVHSVASWLCGVFEDTEDEVKVFTVSLPLRSPRKSRARSSWRDAVLKCQRDIERRVVAFLNLDDQSSNNDLIEQHQEAGNEVINEVERLWLQQRVWLQMHSDSTEAL